jgi:type III pantothenate kinase
VHLAPLLKSLSAALPEGIAPCVVVSTVVERVKHEIVEIAGRIGAVSVVEYDRALPVRLSYASPNSLGPDRLANCLYGNAAFPKQELIIISSGTAITIDYLTANGEFTGGAILAGIGVQLDALAEKAAALPRCEAPEAAPLLPAASTADCIAGGALHGSAGAISHIVDLMRQRYRASPTILATGGAWPLSAALVDFEHRHIPDLTLIGVGLYAAAMTNAQSQAAG